jgi:hypothetical protein
VNFSALTLGSPQCYSRYDYVDQLILQTLAPICVVVLLLISLMLHLIANRNEGTDSRSQIITRYLTLFFILTYLVLPSTSTTIFGAFTCRSIDPDNVAPDTPLYLRNDLSISCSSSRYHLGVYWAIVMIFVYPIGIICMYAYVLYINREDIINQQETESQVVDPIPTSKIGVLSGDGTVSPSASTHARSGVMQYVTSKEIEFLHKAYEGRCWYWEVVETARRLLLTAVLSVVTVGTASRHQDVYHISVVCFRLGLPLAECLTTHRRRGTHMCTCLFIRLYAFFPVVPFISFIYLFGLHRLT